MLTFGPRQFDDDEMLVMAIINRTPDSFYDRGATYAHDAALDRECRGWSVSRRELQVLERSQAQHVWLLRTRLDPASQQRFDELAPAVRLQLAELYLDVFQVPGSVDRAV